MMACPFCKESIQDGALICRHCGSILNATNTINLGTITRSEISEFVGMNVGYYIHKFSDFTYSGRDRFCLTWNWYAFGFGSFWMLYRKMYIQALVTFIFSCIPGLNLFVHIIIGAIGNHLYYEHVKKNIYDLRSIQPQHNFHVALQETGGVNKWVITTSVILCILLLLIVISFFTAITTFIGNTTKITI